MQPGPQGPGTAASGATCVPRRRVGRRDTDMRVLATPSARSRTMMSDRLVATSTRPIRWLADRTSASRLAFRLRPHRHRADAPAFPVGRRRLLASRPCIYEIVGAHHAHECAFSCRPGSKDSAGQCAGSAEGRGMPGLPSCAIPRRPHPERQRDRKPTKGQSRLERDSPAPCTDVLRRQVRQHRRQFLDNGHPPRFERLFALRDRVRELAVQPVLAL